MNTKSARVSILSKLPKNWRAVVNPQTGETLYWTRVCANYLILPAGDGRFQWEYHWNVLGTVDTLQKALLACRENMYEREQISNNTSA